MEFKNDMLLAVMVGIVIGCFLNPITALTLIFMYIFTKNDQLPGNMYPRDMVYNIGLNIWFMANKLVHKPTQIENNDNSLQSSAPILTSIQPQFLQIPPQSIGNNYPAAQIVYVTGVNPQIPSQTPDQIPVTNAISPLDLLRSK